MGKEDVKETGKGRTVMLKVNGKDVKRVDYIRDLYYDGPNGTRTENGMSRSDITKKVNELMGNPEPKMPYQIVFAATKEATRPEAKERVKKEEAPAKAKA